MFYIVKHGMRFHQGMLSVFVFVVVSGPGLALSGCKRKEVTATTTTTAAAVPTRPVTGAPVAFEVTVITPTSLTLRAYNFSPKAVARYRLLIRYLDAAGKPLHVNVGTVLEKDFARWSMQGLDYKCAPTSSCVFRIDGLSVPAGAVKAIVLAESLTALQPNGATFEGTDLFNMPYATQWPVP